MSLKDNKKAAKDAAGPDLSGFLCFAVYSANLAFGRAYKPFLDEIGLTYTQFIAMVALGAEDSLTVSGLGEKLFLESNTLTPILKKLETMGYLRRQRDPADERQVVVSLTDAGRRLSARGVNSGMGKATGLSKAEFADTLQSVVTLRDNLLKNAHDKARDKTRDKDS